ncbi:OmpA family protein [Fulvivirgaceae bacterium BMA10]|uniref:OmpA family protein n=1 Tax=Splendidivirga corallicola TaxID=3051826 RepID=A0ABT8KJQ1_9BACT|nr:OmpA family protein [Fulvivirgaceae bacterium BMA10]
MQNKLRKLLSISTSLMVTMAIVGSSYMLSGCKASNTAKGGLIGAAGGATLGAIIGSGSDNTATGAIIGAVVGGTAGALIGRKMDKQAEELRNDLKGAKVERIGEGIKITFDSGLMFDVNSYGLKSQTKTNLTDLSATLNKYPDTNVLIEGHTDSSGASEYNQKLSDQRAGSVSSYLISKGVAPSRLTTMGYGEMQPIADNETANGREQNRRVEVAIYANEKMKRMAKRGDL